MSYNHIIQALWGIIASDDEILHNPIVPRLYERLHGFKRDQPITKEEMIELY